MVYGGRGGNDAHSAFSVSRSTSTTKMPDMSKLQLDRYDNLGCGVSSVSSLGIQKWNDGKPTKLERN